MVSVLVIDVSPEVREMVRENLTREGYDVITAENMAQGWEQCRNKEPDIMLVAALEPERKELDTAHRLKLFFPKATLLVMTPISRQDLVPESLRIGADDVVVTPLNPERLKMFFKRIQHLYR